MQKRSKYNRSRPITVSFRVNENELAALKQRVLLSGMKKSDFFIKSCIYSPLNIVAGSFTNELLICELQRIVCALKECKDGDRKQVITECRELVCQLISLLK